MKTALIAFAILAGVSGLIAAAAISESGPEPAVHRAVVIDASPSCADQRRCEEVKALAAGGLGDGDLPYTVELLTTGENRDGGASVELGEADYQPMGGLIHGRDQAQKAQQGLLAKVASLCQSIRPTKTSPILEAIRAAVSDLGRYPCGLPGIVCDVAVRSDGEENGSRELMARLKWKASGRIHDPIDLGEIHQVLFCGLDTRKIAVRRGRRALSLDEIEAAWRDAFSDPKKVVFLANCPR